MPGLIHTGGAEFRPKEYLPNADYYNQRWTLRTEEEYPFIAYVHFSCPDKRVLKNIRLYIEKHGEDDVLYHSFNKNYSYCYNLDKAKNTWDENWESVSNQWYKFHFGSDKDLNMCILKHTGVFYTECPDFHPEYYWHTKENTRNY